MPLRGESRYLSVTFSHNLVNFSSSTKQSWTHTPQNKSPVLEEDKSFCSTSISFIFPPRQCISFTSLKTHPELKADPEPCPRGTWEGRPSPRCRGLPAGLRARSGSRSALAPQHRESLWQLSSEMRPQLCPGSFPRPRERGGWAPGSPLLSYLLWPLQPGEGKRRWWARLQPSPRATFSFSTLWTISASPCCAPTSMN